MKTQLTAEQSAELFKRGVSPYKASEIEEYNDAVSKWTHRGQPIFTLSDLLSLLPKEINGYTLKIEAKTDKWEVEYSAIFKYTGWEALRDAGSAELIDCLYSLLFWLLDNNYLNKE